MDYMVDENAIKANAAEWVGDELHVEMMNGCTFIVPRWLLPELKSMAMAQLNDIEIIDGGRGILFGDKEGVSMQRLLGIMPEGDKHKATGTFEVV